MTLDIILHPIPNSFNRVKIRRVGLPKNRLNEPLIGILHCTCCYVSRRIILHYGKPRSHRDHAIDKRNYFLAIFLGVNGTPFFLPKQTRAFFWPCEASPEHPSDPILRFFSNTISIVFLEHFSCNQYSRISSILYPSFVCP
ncbi:BgTH12-02785 [Blumeria graminis f. sp. triticale]|uniref:BgTH12-02785 n=1 Tax=Blumeria graminis f. sp. triticale TaxID=1689686 RepID=A0A9W4D2V7_BLUGR|nr:BgTH12-02785 [Blumeria graminis f. sp. triticale]